MLVVVADVPDQLDEARSLALEPAAQTADRSRVRELGNADVMPGLHAFPQSERGRRYAPDFGLKDKEGRADNFLDILAFGFGHELFVLRILLRCGFLAGLFRSPYQTAEIPEYLQKAIIRDLVFELPKLGVTSAPRSRSENVIVSHCRFLSRF
jgi:hypothetical protein